MASRALKTVKAQKIEFVRVERNTTWNQNLRKEGKTRGIIYDFDVLIGGERRAIWKRISFGNYYELFDGDHRRLMTRGEPGRVWSIRQIEVRSQERFAAVIESALMDDLIPTLAEMARLRLIEEAWGEHKARLQAEEDRIERIRSAAVPMYKALQRALFVLESPALQPLTNGAGTVDVVRAAIAQAEGKVTDADQATD